ncbi:MOSC domain-containing protein [Aestuariimicrobium soli]|uniref:MOSC domain-containing protein n=1 Tax=Aestuariimicrobium soli TaxID=2035834 RepID=UPI003EC097F5
MTDTAGTDTVAPPTVRAVHRSPSHSFSKQTLEQVTLVEGIGVEGDAHAGVSVKHRSRVAKNPSTPNLRQVHLMHQELFDQLALVGHEVRPGDLGENITTQGLDLLGLPVGTRLTIGEAVITVTGLRNPCNQINDFQPGLLKQVLTTTDDGEVVRLAGVMGIVSRGGIVATGDPIEVTLPPEPLLPLTPV